MRCPKCGYITFDHLETCTKCRKNIAAAAAQLSGTTFQAEAPSFLQFKVQAVTEHGDSVNVFSEDSDIELDMAVEGADNDIEFNFEEESADAPDVAAFEDDDFDLPLTDDEVDLDLDGGVDVADDDNKGPQLDFSELDISDLAPPAEDELPAGELTLEESGSAAAGSSATPALGVSGGGLEDLQMEGLDLGIPTTAPAGSATGAAIKPAVKTGTALDDFDIDLGELTSDRDK